jgi:uncharacterized protein YbjT (DUF2867 family)
MMAGGNSMKVVVIGGTGLIGSRTVQKLKDKGHQALAAAPNTGIDTITGKGLAEALAGAEVVVDVSNSPSMDDRAAMDFFQTSSRNLIAAEQDAGVDHHVALSVVGTDRLQDSGYFRAKQAQEQLVEASPVPFSLIHATQFFEFIRSIANGSTIDGAVRLAPVKFQPMAAEDVADAIVETALGEPSNRMTEIAGPETFRFDQAVARVLQYDGDSRKVIADASAPYYGVALSETTLVPGPGARIGRTRLDWWLKHVPAPPKVSQPARVPQPAH